MTEVDWTQVVTDRFDGDPDGIIDRHLDRMTAREKAGQLVMARTYDAPGEMPGEDTKRAIRELNAGSAHVRDRNGPADAAVYNTRLQELAADTRLGVPLLISSDFEFGTSHAIHSGTTTLPRHLGIGATRSEEFAATAARITASEMRALGYHWNFAPIADVNTNPRNPVIGVRSFGEREDLVADLAESQVDVYQENHVIATPEHFPGHGDTDVDSHLDLPHVSVDRETFEEIHLSPFRTTIDAGADSVMTAHIVVDAIDSELPGTLSSDVLTGLLRERLEFDGIIITDSMAMNAIAENWETGEAAVLAVQAGADVIISPKSVEGQEATVDALEDAIASGNLSEERVNASIRRILSAKFEYVDSLSQDPAAAIETCANPEHQQSADEIARESITLVKNEGVLPLSSASDDTILVAGVEAIDTLADPIDAIADADVTSWQAATREPIDAEIRAAAALAEDADDVIVATYSADELPDEQVELLEAVRECSDSVIAVSAGLPYDVARYPDVDAYVATYAMDRWQRSNPTVMRAAADVLFGANPGGTLPVTIEDYYPYGHGLQYGDSTDSS